MSTAQTPTFGLPTETNGSNGSNSDSGGLGSRGANYFFGFLITFVVLLLIFIGCGIGSRRRFMARRNAMLAGAYEPWGPLSKDGSRFQTQPELYEKLVSNPVVEDQWRDTMPLSATYRRGPPEANTQELLQGMYDHEMQPPHNELDNAPHHHDQEPRRLGQHLRTWIPGLSNTPKEHEIEDATENEKTEPPPPEFLDVAVMIAMPTHPPVRLSSCYRDIEESCDEGSGGSLSKDHPPVQLHIGTVSMPLDWSIGLLVLPPPPRPAPFSTTLQ